MALEPFGLFDAICDAVAIGLDETVRCWERTSSAEVQGLFRAVATATHLSMVGPGRTGHILAALAARLGEHGADIGLLAQDALPLPVAGTTLLIACASGATDWLCAYAGSAKASGARLAVCTGGRHSPLARLADVVLWIDAIAPAGGRPGASHQRHGVLFDQALFVILDAMAETIERHGRSLAERAGS